MHLLFLNPSIESSSLKSSKKIQFSKNDSSSNLIINNDIDNTYRSDLSYLKSKQASNNNEDDQDRCQQQLEQICSNNFQNNNNIILPEINTGN